MGNPPIPRALCRHWARTLSFIQPAIFSGEWLRVYRKPKHVHKYIVAQILFGGFLLCTFSWIFPWLLCVTLLLSFIGDLSVDQWCPTESDPDINIDHMFLLWRFKMLTKNKSRRESLFLRGGLFLSAQQGTGITDTSPRASKTIRWPLKQRRSIGFCGSWSSNSTVLYLWYLYKYKYKRHSRAIC